jgi:phosphate ABC transporter phosphate-binding protein
MQRTLGFSAFSLAVLALSLLSSSGCGDSSKRLNAGGSTFVYPMMSKWADEYKKATGIEVNYQSIGSGGGIQQMTAKTFDFGCTDGPMNEEQLKKCRDSGGEAVHIPLVLGAVVPTYNLAGVTEPLKFTGPVLADIYLGKIAKWNDTALKGLNPEAALPDQEIVVVHRSDGSGTTYVWVDYLAKVSSEWKTKAGVGTSVDWPTGIGQKGNEGVAGQVRRSGGSIGYVELEYALQNQMSVGLVRNKEGTFVTPSLASVIAAGEAGLKNIPDDLRYSLTDGPGKDSYSISGTTWVVVYDTLPAGKGQQVIDFLRWATHDGQKYCEGLHYVKLPPGLVERVDKKLAGIKVSP